MKKLTLFFLAVLVALWSSSQNTDATKSAKPDESRMQWWKDAKFGLFIHWGIYSVPAGKWGETTTYGEWIMHSAKIPRVEYSALAKQFNPTGFNANDWVKLAKDAGMKYITFTTRR